MFGRWIETTFHCVPRVLNLRYSLVCTSIISKGCTSSSSDDFDISNVGFFSYARTEEEARQLTFFYRIGVCH